MTLASLTRINSTIESVHNTRAARMVSVIRDAVQESALPMRIDVKRVPVSGDLNFCRIMITGDCFNIGGRKIINDAIKTAKGV